MTRTDVKLSTRDTRLLLSRCVMQVRRQRQLLTLDEEEVPELLMVFEHGRRRQRWSKQWHRLLRKHVQPAGNNSNQTPLNLHDMIISYTSTNDVGISVSIWLISAQQNVFGYCAMTSHRPSHHIRHGRITQGYWIWKLLAQNVLENIFRIVCRSASLLACM